MWKPLGGFPHFLKQIIFLLRISKEVIVFHRSLSPFLGNKNSTALLGVAFVVGRYCGSLENCNPTLTQSQGGVNGVIYRNDGCIDVCMFAGINVPRSRFLPVKKTSDLLLLMSNLYDIDSGSLTLSALRSFPTTPLVKLGNCFDKVGRAGCGLPFA